MTEQPAPYKPNPTLKRVETGFENLMTFPFVRDAVERGDTTLHGAYFGVSEGSLFVLDRTTKEFQKASE